MRGRGPSQGGVRGRRGALLGLAGAGGLCLPVAGRRPPPARAEEEADPLAVERKVEQIRESAKLIDQERYKIKGKVDSEAMVLEAEAESKRQRLESQASQARNLLDAKEIEAQALITKAQQEGDAKRVEAAERRLAEVEKQKSELLQEEGLLSSELSRGELLTKAKQFEKKKVVDREANSLLTGLNKAMQELLVPKVPK